MRVGFFFSEFFWGGLLILLGLSAILKSFNINIPLFRIVFALFFIYLGITILLGNGLIFERDRNTVLFNDTVVRVADDIDKEYNIIFGKGTIDLTHVPHENLSREIEVNAIFGSGIVKIKGDIPVRIDGSSAFANLRMPDGNNISFGDLTYRSMDIKPGEKYLRIKASTVFGSMNIITE